ncbi:putative disease resistance protein [Platanthera zijinensis]|uniref:Disease resistance protein n=1 Tax=Platanthera zijinensis TaxID=2320716 RepID=A0AAP0B583_9ASPA
MGSSVDEALYDREDDVRNLIDLLLKEGTENHPNVALVPLVGNEGIGKTALAQFIYEDPRICEHFERRGWVYFSEVSDPIMLIRQILESITLSPWSWAEPSSLQRSLEDELKNKRYLIVLDDFCIENSKYLEGVCDSLSLGRSGSKILPIMRETWITNAFQTVQTQRLERLSDESCWQLFQKHAFPFPSHGHAIDPNLMSLGRKISEKCYGILLPIKILGSFLCYETDRVVWETLCESDKWDSSDSQNLVLSALRICYGSLPLELQLCLSYCSLFPKSQLFDKDQLIRLWMAQGYINPVKGKELEQTGCEYFDQLLRKNWFFHSSSDDYNKQGFTMQHQVFNMLTKSLSGNEISKVEDENISYAHERARHLLYGAAKDEAEVQLKCSAESASLHTFLVITKSESSSIGTLINLRFLGANCTKIKTLPQSICNLHNLQTLELNDCSYLVALPVGISFLSNLHHLLISKGYSFARLPRGIGKLTSLVTLSTFYIGSDSSIAELKNLVNLSGELCISGLSNIIGVDDAMEANMKNKEFIGKLILEWNSIDFCSKSYMSVLESLQPHTNIKELVMENYEGRKLSSWMGDSSLSKLVSISLSNCHECEVLPPLGQLPSLKHLMLHGFNKLRHLGAEFYGHGGSDGKPFSSLEKLEFEGMYALEEWGGVDGAFPLLLELCLHYCQKLKSMPQIFSSLKNLKLSHCERLTRLPNAPLMSSFRFISLQQNIVSVLPEQITELGSIKIYCDKFVDFRVVA